jgi:hypothetical protein
VQNLFKMNLPIGLSLMTADRNKSRHLHHFLLFLLFFFLLTLERIRFLFEREGRWRGVWRMELAHGRDLPHLLDDRDAVAGQPAKGDPGQRVMLEEGVEQLLLWSRQLGRGNTVAAGQVGVLVIAAFPFRFRLKNNTKVMFNQLY